MPGRRLCSSGRRRNPQKVRCLILAAASIEPLTSAQVLPTWPVALQNPKIVRPLEDRRFRDVTLTHAAANIVERLEVPRLKPALEAVEQRFHIVDSMPQKRRAGHHNVSTGEQVLYDLVGSLHAGAGRKRRPDPPRQNANPKQRETDFGGCAELDTRQQRKSC